MNTKPVTFTLAAIACIVMLLIWTRYLTPGPTDPPTPVEKPRLKTIEHAIQFYSIDHSGLPKGSERFDAADWYQLVRKYVSDSPIWDKRKKLVDVWENDYQFKTVVFTNERAQSISEIKIWSCGPNRKNEHGQGDDIVVSFQVRP